MCTCIMQTNFSPNVFIFGNPYCVDRLLDIVGADSIISEMRGNLCTSAGLEIYVTACTCEGKIHNLIIE